MLKQHKGFLQLDFVWNDYMLITHLESNNWLPWTLDMHLNEDSNDTDNDWGKNRECSDQFGPLLVWHICIQSLLFLAVRFLGQCYDSTTTTIGCNTSNVGLSGSIPIEIRPQNKLNSCLTLPPSHCFILQSQNKSAYIIFHWTQLKLSRDRIMLGDMTIKQNIARGTTDPWVDTITGGAL